MSPLESLRRFQIDCGDLEAPETPLNAAVIPPAPLEPRYDMVSFGEPVPDLPPPTAVMVAESSVPPLVNVPITPVIEAPLTPVVTPEPDTLLLVLTGVGVFAYLAKRRGQVEVSRASSVS